MSEFIPGVWKKCRWLNKGKTCLAFPRHRQHKKVFGVWYYRAG